MAEAHEEEEADPVEEEGRQERREEDEVVAQESGVGRGVSGRRRCLIRVTFAIYYSNQVGFSIQIDKNSNFTTLIFTL